MKDKNWKDNFDSLKENKDLIGLPSVAFNAKKIRYCQDH